MSLLYVGMNHFSSEMSVEVLHMHSYCYIARCMQALIM